MDCLSCEVEMEVDCLSCEGNVKVDCFSCSSENIEADCFSCSSEDDMEVDYFSCKRSSGIIRLKGSVILFTLKSCEGEVLNEFPCSIFLDELVSSLISFNFPCLITSLKYQTSSSNAAIMN
ncbi:hypothetical protein RhiirC2_792814 [Rhizophagus irregularis]|uniref:Uncharacterized protein n=1 Tax=Rhizophagus irregularis TaxID=588596 RepID=A0A2N1MGU3_9GLOM|nr:hypothetical protein RhiirC2_792814 [Rhizophagus irregularis]